jgi:hypothetical protein
VDKQCFPDAIAVDAATGELSLEVRLDAELESAETLDIRRFMASRAAARGL